MQTKRHAIVPTWFLFVFALMGIGVLVMGGYGISQQLKVKVSEPVTVSGTPDAGTQSNQFNVMGQNTNPPPFDPTASSGNGTKPQGLDPAQLSALQNVDPAILRQVLIEGGINKADLDKLDDKALLEIYRKTLAQLPTTKP